MTAHPARAAGLASVMAMVAGAAHAAQQPHGAVLAASSVPADPEAVEVPTAALEAACGRDGAAR